MLIKDSQISVLGSQPREGFIVNTVNFLRGNAEEWSSKRTDEQVRGVIEEMIEIGEKNHIRKEINIQKLLYYSIVNELQIPFSEAIHEIIQAPDLGEDLRTKNFIKAIVKNHVR